MTISVRGRLGDSPSQYLNVAFITYLGLGIKCSRFERPVAVIGFTDENDPILVTDVGPLVIEGRALIPGCECGRLLPREKAQEEVRILTPSLDPWATGYPPQNLSYDDSGNLFIATGAGCVRVTKGEMFAVVPDNHCQPMEVLGYMGVETWETLYRAVGAERVLLLEAVPCYD